MTVLQFINVTSWRIGKCGKCNNTIVTDEQVMVKWKTHWENSRALESFRENEKIDEEQKKWHEC